MNDLLCAVILSSALLVANAAEPVAAPERERMQACLNFDWKFHQGDAEGAQDPAFDDSKWEVVNVPHDWSVGEPFNEKVVQGEACGFLPRGIGWYRKTFPSPQAGERVFLDFDGVCTAADVWLNGTHLGKNYNGYLGFQYDVTDHLNPAGELNVLVVRADNSRVGSSRWYTGSGIYRDVNLVITGLVYVPRYGVWITTPKITRDQADVHVETIVTNGGAKAGEVTVTTEIYDPAGKLAATGAKTARLKPGASTTIQQDLSVDRPELWSPEKPNLYKASSRVAVDGKSCDLVETNFGIRTIQFTPEQGLLVNGKKVNVKGINIHHDLGCLGAAAFERGFERRLELMKAMGCNAVRLAHNPYQPALP